MQRIRVCDSLDMDIEEELMFLLRSDQSGSGNSGPPLTGFFLHCFGQRRLLIIRI